MTAKALVPAMILAATRAPWDTRAVMIEGPSREALELVEVK
jgi:hypothetical protein